MHPIATMSTRMTELSPATAAMPMRMSAQQTHRRVLRRLLRLLAEVGDGFESGIREEDNRRGDEDTGDVSGPAPGDDRGTECEFEDEIPCDDPGEDLTDRGVGVGIGTALRWELPLPVPHSRGQRGERRVLQ